MKNLFCMFCILLSILTACVSCSENEGSNLGQTVINQEERLTHKLVDLSLLDNSESVYVYDESNLQLNRNELQELPVLPGTYDPFSVDLRAYNLKNLSLKHDKDRLDLCVFDNNTIWPDELPEGFDPDEILELGKDPGLGIRDLHKEGITGRGVNVAIIDAQLMVDHEEYRKNIITYEYIHSINDPAQMHDSAQMHGSLVTSLLVGESVGVAPEANVYYISSTLGDFLESGPEVNYNYIVEGINRVLDINSHLGNGNKIRVISISIGLSKNGKGYDNVIKAIDRANEEGVFVLTTTPEWNFDYLIGGLSREPLSDPNKSESYKIGSLLYWGPRSDPEIFIYECLVLPMDNRTSALPTGSQDYQYFNQGGNSNLVPWLAGLYALCIQVEPEFNPERFFKIAYDTADAVSYKNSRRQTIKVRIINPKKIISEIK